MKLISILLIAFLLTFAGILNSQIPEKMAYQGYLTNINGDAVDDGTYAITFSLYNTATGGTSLWTELQSAEVNSGVINVVLGSVSPLTITFNQPLWLGISIENELEFTPRVELTASPYSLMAKSVMKDAIGSFSIADNSIILRKINTDEAEKGQIMKFDGDSLIWSKDLTGSGGGGSFSLPFKETVDFLETAFWIIQKGNGTVARFDVDNILGGPYAIQATSNAQVATGFFKNDNLLETGANAIYGLSEGAAATAKFVNSGIGNAGYFEITGANNVGSAIYGYSNLADAKAGEFLVGQSGGAASNALFADHKGSGDCISAQHSGAAGSALFVHTHSINNADPALSANTEGQGNAAYFMKEIDGSSVVSIENNGFSKHALEVNDIKSSGSSVYIKQHGEDNLKPTLEVIGGHKKYSYLATFTEEYLGSGVKIDIKKEDNKWNGLYVNNNGKGMGVDIYTRNIEQNSEIAGTEASLRVITATTKNVPIAYLKSTDSTFVGPGILLVQNGLGSGIEIDMMNDGLNDHGIDIYQSGTGIGINVEKSSKGYAGYFVRTIADTTPTLYANGFGFGPALKGEGNLFGGYFSNNTNSGTGAALTAEALGGNSLAIKTNGYIEIENGALYVDGGINIANSTTVLGTDLQLGGQIITQGAASIGSNLSVTGGATIQQSTMIYGDLDVTGTVSKGGGSFKIDHPLDPENKYLYHSFVESPDMKNIYDGVAEFDGKGEATVTFPDWFEALNKDFRYQLTCIGGYAQVYIAQEIDNNMFKIAGGLPGMKVSWQVTGIRKDNFANAHRIPVEEMKSPAEQGFYLHPGAFGLPESSSIRNAQK